MRGWTEPEGEATQRGKNKDISRLNDLKSIFFYRRATPRDRCLGRSLASSVDTWFFLHLQKMSVFCSLKKSFFQSHFRVFSETEQFFRLAPNFYQRRMFHDEPTFAMSSSQMAVSSSFSLTFWSTLRSRLAAFISVFFSIAVSRAISASWKKVVEVSSIFELTSSLNGVEVNQVKLVWVRTPSRLLR